MVERLCSPRAYVDNQKPRPIPGRPYRLEELPAELSPVPVAADTEVYSYYFLDRVRPHVSFTIGQRLHVPSRVCIP